MAVNLGKLNRKFDNITDKMGESIVELNTFAKKYEVAAKSTPNSSSYASLAELSASAKLNQSMTSAAAYVMKFSTILAEAMELLCNSKSTSDLVKAQELIHLASDNFIPSALRPLPTNSTKFSSFFSRKQASPSEAIQKILDNTKKEVDALLKMGVTLSPKPE